MGKMQESMLKMHEKIHKTMDAKNPQEREQLTQEQTRMMQDHMKAMGGDAKDRKMDGGMKACEMACTAW